MLREAQDLLTQPVRAEDGKAGRVADIYFDDREWRAREMVVDVGVWPLRKEVLIDPLQVLKPHPDDTELRLYASKQELKLAPDSSAVLPVAKQEQLVRDRQKRESMARLASRIAHSLGEKPTRWFDKWQNRHVERLTKESEILSSSDRNLRSVREVIGYRAQAERGRAGRVEDLLFDDETWTVRYFEVRTRFLLVEKVVLVPTRWVRSIDWESRKLHLELPARLIRRAPAFDPHAPLSPRHETALFNYYATAAG